ncbi:hypothetical protein M427DRAFT_152287 [Gonapodya prolifera JEL478]|uniref:Uncharacterized protein n=1 Tax=Gonapodya prolifera (strain JEL478) TaxID=1344416 RepID=A0A139ASW5_GONPJ|nr:hypothetical protein M427DRAFT_152287 [Gonapodya prolifera JEL478]|eukprot:KXS19827.1 hypothetical protein M427DRAFT_152287 [Gonapodya prolifera JEL478]
MGKKTARIGGIPPLESNIVTRSITAKAASQSQSSAPWLVRLPPEVLYYHLIFPYVPPETFYTVLPLVCRDFAREFSRRRIPVSISLITSQTEQAMSRNGASGQENNFDFTIGPLVDKSENSPGPWSRLPNPRENLRSNTKKPGLYVAKDIHISFQDRFHDAAPEDKEITRNGYATRPSKDFCTLYPRYWATRSGSQIFYSDDRSSDVVMRRKQWFGVSAAVRVHSHHNAHQTTPAYRQPINIANLALDSLEHHMKRSVLGLFHSLEVQYADFTFAVSLESLTRTVNPRHLVLPSPVLEDIRWEGTRLCNVRSLRLTHQNAADSDVEVGLDLEGWESLETLHVSTESDGCSVYPHLCRLIGFGGDGDWAAQNGLGTGWKSLKTLEIAAGAKSELYEALKTFRIVASFKNLSTISIENWASRTKFRPFSLSNPDTVLNDSFTSLPNHLPKLTSFGTVFYVPDRFNAIAGGEEVDGMPGIDDAIVGSYPNLRRLAIAMPPDGVRDRSGNLRAPTMTLSRWKGLGDTLRRLTPSLEELEVSKVDIDLFLREGDPDSRKVTAVPGHLAKVVEAILGAVAGGKPGAAKRGCEHLQKIRIKVKTWDWWRGPNVHVGVKLEAAKRARMMARKYGVDAETEFC